MVEGPHASYGTRSLINRLHIANLPCHSHLSHLATSSISPPVRLHSMTSLLLGSQIARPAVGLCSDRSRELRADGPATVLAIGTANPPNCVRQEEYADYYFRVTKSEHLTSLKDKLKRICKYLTACLVTRQP